MKSLTTQSVLYLSFMDSSHKESWETVVCEMLRILLEIHGSPHRTITYRVPWVETDYRSSSTMWSLCFFLEIVFYILLIHVYFFCDAEGHCDDSRTLNMKVGFCSQTLYFSASLCSLQSSIKDESIFFRFSLCSLECGRITGQAVDFGHEKKSKLQITFNN